MSNHTWTGSAQPIAQVTTCTVGGTVEVGDIFTITIGSKVMTHVATSTTLATVAAAIVTDFNALSRTLWPEFAEIVAAYTSGGSFTLTGRTAGVPFVVTLATTESGGGAADAQTFTQSATTAATGPAFWGVAANWLEAVVPGAADDVVIPAGSPPIKYDLDQNTITLNSLTIGKSAKIGNDNLNPNNYAEYREKYLKISATTITIDGASRTRLNVGSVQTAVHVLDTEQPTSQNTKTVEILGTHASNTMIVDKGWVASADNPFESSTWATIKQGFVSSPNSDSDVRLGSGVTLSGCTITKTGGKLEINSNLSTINQYSGAETVIKGTATIGTALILGGQLVDKSSGTKTTMSVRGTGTIDKSQALVAATYTNTNVGKGGTLKDPAKQITLTNPIALTCSLAECTLDLGNTFNLQRS